MDVGLVGEERAAVMLDAVDVDAYYVAAGYKKRGEGHGSQVDVSGVIDAAEGTDLDGQHR